MLQLAWPLLIDRRSRERGRDALQRIADTLSIPVETLRDAAGAESYPDDGAELVRLWFKIQDPEARRRIIEHAREAAGE